MATRILETQRGLSYLEAQRSSLTIWDLMHHVELEARRELFAAIKSSEYPEIPDIHYEWQRQHKPYQAFLLRAWCTIVVEV